MKIIVHLSPDIEATILVGSSGGTEPVPSCSSWSSSWPTIAQYFIMSTMLENQQLIQLVLLPLCSSSSYLSSSIDGKNQQSSSSLHTKYILRYGDGYATLILVNWAEITTTTTKNDGGTTAINEDDDNQKSFVQTNITLRPRGIDANTAALMLVHQSSGDVIHVDLMIEKVGQLNEEKECDSGVVVRPAKLTHLYDINKMNVLCIEESLVYPSLVENYRVKTLQSLLLTILNNQHMSSALLVPKNISPSTTTRVIETQHRPSPNLPTHLACGRKLPSKCFNPFNLAAPQGMWDEIGRDIPICISALLGYDSIQSFLMLHLKDIHQNMNIDEIMETERYVGFCIHDERDVILCGLNKTAAADSFRIVAKARNATAVVDKAVDMINIVKMNAKRESKTFAVTDDYTTRFGYSVNQLGPLRTMTNSQLLTRTVARGGPAQVQFVKNKKRHHRRQCDDNLLTSRAGIRMLMVHAAEQVSPDFIKWRQIKRPRVTSNSQMNNTRVRAPFTLDASLPDETNEPQVTLAKWESSLRAIEEHLMISLFGMIPNIIWASVLARVFENAGISMGDFNLQTYKAWTRSGNTVSPGELGCPWKGCASRILPKGACGISPSKPMHDDNNGVISLSCWTSLTESDAATNLVFLINGFEVSLHASLLRWVLFMGYIPHETRPANSQQPPTDPRLHHSSFVKPEAEYLAAHILSNLPCKAGGGDWSMDFVNSKNGMQNDVVMSPILKRK